MLIVGADVLIKAARRHRDAARPLASWQRIVETAQWQSLSDVRRVFPTADGVTADSGAVVTVFNIRGNTYRLLTRISYRTQQIRPIELLTHAEYDKDQWKKRL